MDMARTGRNWLLAAAFAACLAAANPALAVERYSAGTPSAAAMGFDVLLVRPTSLAATAIGTGLFVVSLPFSLLGMNADDAAAALIGKPAEYTFIRPLGDFQDAAEARSRY